MRSLHRVIALVNLVICCVCAVQAIAIPHKEQDDTELILVSVMFRHGARTTLSFYPNDPNKNETFYPIGMGGLTNDGKMGEFKLGRYLKNLYGEFVGDDYTEDKVYIRSTDVTRTKMSAQLVLAGLFPPSKIQQWNDELMWQPIPVAYKTDAEEDLFHPYISCPYKIDVINKLPSVPEVYDKYIKPYEEQFSYIKLNSGKDMKTPADMQDLYFILKTENDMGLIMPAWTQNIFPKPAKQIAAQTYGYDNYDPRVRQINAGYLLKKIVDDSKSKINDPGKARKIYLYSGHESTLGYMLDALNVTQPLVPPYGSALSFEIHRGADDQHYIKLRYRDDTEGVEPVDLQVPGCAILCPLDDFVELQKDLLPTISIQDNCKKSSAPESVKEKEENYL